MTTRSATHAPGTSPRDAHQALENRTATPARLTNDAVKSARLLVAQGLDYQQIARDFGFDPAALRDAIEGVTFRYITDPPKVRCETPGRQLATESHIIEARLDGQRLRRIRAGQLQLSQEQFASEIRAAGNVLGVPNRCTKRLVQKWESGEHKMPSAGYQLALAHVIGPGVETLYLKVLPDVVDDTMRQLAAVLPLFAETYNKLIELNAHLVHRADKSGAVARSPSRHARFRARAASSHPHEQSEPGSADEERPVRQVPAAAGPLGGQ